MVEPARYVTQQDRTRLTPVYAVWEITLACDLKCQHCGSRAGKRRPDELSTEECLDLVRQMARLGTREVTLIGGEAYLRRDWLQIIREIRDQGMNCTLQTGGLHLTEERVRQAADAGLQAAGVSIDGLRDLHDTLRGVKGSYDAAFAALGHLKKYNLQSSVNTQIGAGVIPQLRELMHLFIEAGARNWQLQLTVAMGRAADHPELLLQPYEMLELMPLIAELYDEGFEHDFMVQPGNNIGYFGPYESVWRGKGDDSVHWVSCNAGQNTLGIEADGTIKGCPSLPTSPYAGGNIRDLTLEDLWQTPELSFTRTRTANDLWGFCGTCYYADVCRAGCTWTTHVLFGRAGNNPFCHHRALELEKRGLRERIVQTAPAPGLPFDHGRFELLVEKNDGQPLPVADGKGGATAVFGSSSLVQIKPARRKKKGPQEGLKAMSPDYQEMPYLKVCHGCNRHVLPATETCPHCDGDIKTFERAYQKKLRAARAAYRELLEHFPQL